MDRIEIGINLPMTRWEHGADPNLTLAIDAERLGYTSVWTEEAYGADAVAPLAWVGARTSRIDLGSAIWQIPARTPAMAGMTAATLDALSGGRLRIGLGMSGPQVVEGWHGQPFEHLLGRTREYIEVLRLILARDGDVDYRGKHYQLPYTGDRGLGLGKPLRLILHPVRSHVPIYVGALGPRNLELTAELADGWLPIFFAPRCYDDVFAEPLEQGFQRADGDKAPGRGFDVAPIVSVSVGDDVDACRQPVREKLALYIGGMGAAKRNFSNQLIRRFGYDDAAEEVQTKFLAGDRAGAERAVPDELIDDIALCGPAERIEELLGRWRESPVTTIICDIHGRAALETMAELLAPGATARPAEDPEP